ncbi:unnamed protein product [Brachionus calyciflorus]|uniref:Uncharacterized protein n=1 Tax=Brachionus calyciflorus TaxID=104777 RepID=A0A814LSC1_9BILA|nr:unnamed protein product [Brachionus calyciflorus]
MMKNLEKSVKQNQKQLETQVQKDLNALKKMMKWTKIIQKRIENNRRKLNELKTEPMNNLNDNKLDSIDIMQPLMTQSKETTTPIKRQYSINKTEQIFRPKDDTINEKIQVKSSFRRLDGLGNIKI